MNVIWNTVIYSNKFLYVDRKTILNVLKCEIKDLKLIFCVLFNK